MGRGEKGTVEAGRGRRRGIVCGVQQVPRLQELHARLVSTQLVKGSRRPYLKVEHTPAAPTRTALTALVCRPVVKGTLW